MQYLYLLVGVSGVWVKFSEAERKLKWMMEL